MRIAITVGDPAGIGPEISLKALAAELPQDQVRYTLFGNIPQLLGLNAALGLHLPLFPASKASSSERLVIHDGGPDSEQPHTYLPLTSTAAMASMAWLSASAKACLDRHCDALVTGPVSKEAIIDAGHPRFVGQTEFLSEMAGVTDTIMMLLGPDTSGRWLRVALATVHIPISQVASSLSSERITLAIRRAGDACKDLGLPRHRVAVCGLNPHAGEGGKIGDEELRIIKPAIEAAKRAGADVVGPMPADTLFHFAYRGDCDAVVAMYHDQGLAPLKMVAFESGINWTLGLPFIRTSPDHGTAFDIAGQGIANSRSMLAALRLAKRLAVNRSTPRSEAP